MVSAPFARDTCAASQLAPHWRRRGNPLAGSGRGYQRGRPSGGPAVGRDSGVLAAMASGPQSRVNVRRRAGRGFSIITTVPGSNACNRIVCPEQQTQADLTGVISQNAVSWESRGGDTSTVGQTRPAARGIRTVFRLDWQWKKHRRLRSIGLLGSFFVRHRQRTFVQCGHA